MHSADHTISVVRANVVAVLITPVPIVVLGLVYHTLWGWPKYDSVELFNGIKWLLAFGTLSCGVHEVLHALGFRYAGHTPWRRIHFGVRWELLIPYVSSDAPMSARGYRIAAALPALVLGVVPAILGLILGSLVVTCYAAMMLVAAGSDVIAIWVTRKVPPDALVIDSETRIGCTVVTPVPAEEPVYSERAA